MSDGEGKSSKDVKTALIAAGATVLAALITVLGSHYWPEKSNRTENTPAPSRTESVQPTVSVYQPPDQQKSESSVIPEVRPEPVPAARPAAPASVSFSQQISGEYALQSYSVNGSPLPLRGSMTLHHSSDTELQFESELTRLDIPGSDFHYRGVMRAVGGVWQVIFSETNDPTVLIGQAVANSVSYQSGILGFQSEYGHIVVWRKLEN